MLGFWIRGIVNLGLCMNCCFVGLFTLFALCWELLVDLLIRLIWVNCFRMFDGSSLMLRLLCIYDV